jgi:hypothetical protein
MRKITNGSVAAEFVLLAALWGCADAKPVPMYKPSSRSSQAMDITKNNYGTSRTAPYALNIGDIAPDFTVSGPNATTVSSVNGRRRGPLSWCSIAVIGDLPVTCNSASCRISSNASIVAKYP